MQILLRNLLIPGATGRGLEKPQYPCDVIVVGFHHGVGGQFNQQFTGCGLRRLEELEIAPEDR